MESTQEKIVYTCLKQPQEPHKIMYILNKDISGTGFLGKGACGQVFKGYRYDETKTDKKGAEVAVKVIQIKGMDLDSEKGLGKTIKNEVQLFQKFNHKLMTHPNLITIHDVYQTQNNIYIVMELCDKDCTLKDYFHGLNKYNQTLSEQEVIHILNDILRGLYCLNQEGIMHRDIKSENIIRVSKDSNTWKLCDYGFTKIIEDGNLLSKQNFTKLGTPFYMSPQILNDKKYNFKTDVYSSGIVLYQILFKGKYPFQANCLQTLIELTNNGLKLKSSLDISPDMELLLKKMMSLNEQERPSLKNGDLFRLKEYQNLMYGVNLEKCFLLQQVKDQDSIQQSFHFHLQNRILIQNQKQKFLQNTDKSLKIAVRMNLEIQSFIQTNYATMQFFLHYNSFTVDHKYRWLTLFSLAKIIQLKCQLTGAYAYEEQINLYNFNENEWKQFTKTKVFEDQKNLIHIVKTQIQEMYDRILTIGMVVEEKYFKDFKDKIYIAFTNQLPKQQQELQKNKAIFYCLMQQKILQSTNDNQFIDEMKQKQYLISLIGLCQVVVFREEFKESFIIEKQDINVIPVYYKQLIHKSVDELQKKFEKLKSQVLKKKVKTEGFF